MAQWRSAGLSIPTVSVNLSPLHFSDYGLPKFVAGLLNEFELPPGCLTVEITESVMMDAGPEALKTLAALHEIGVGLSMDDFGTGFSSLSSLTQMPINELKLDRSFMRNFETDPSAQAVTTAGGAHRAESWHDGGLGRRRNRGSGPAASPSQLLGGAGILFRQGDARLRSRTVDRRGPAGGRRPPRRPRLRTAVRSEKALRPGPD